MEIIAHQHFSNSNYVIISFYYTLVAVCKPLFHYPFVLLKLTIIGQVKFDTMY